MIVAPDRETPGKSARHWAIPVPRACFSVMLVGLRHVGRCSIFSMKRIAIPPAMSAPATVIGLNRYALMALCVGKADKRRREKGNEDIDRQGAVFFAARKPPDHAQNLFPVNPDHREDRPELDDDLEDLCLFVVETDEVACKDQVPRGGDGDELGYPFHDAQKEAFEKQYQIHRTSNCREIVLSVSKAAK